MTLCTQLPVQSIPPILSLSLSSASYTLQMQYIIAPP